MKYKLHVLLIAFGTLSFGFAKAQSTAIDKYYSKYSEDDRFTKVYISSKMFGLFTEFESNDEKEKAMAETISKLTGLKMLVGEQIDGANDIFQDLAKAPQGSMEELMTVEKEGAEFKFFIAENGGKISELLMLVGEKTHLMMMSIVGDISLSDLAKLSHHMNINGFEHLENISGSAQ